MIIQGIIAVGALINLATHMHKASKQEALKTAASEYDFIQSNIEANNRLIEEAKKKAQELKNKGKDKTEDDALEIKRLEQAVRDYNTNSGRLQIKQDELKKDKDNYVNSKDIEFKGTDKVEAKSSDENSLWD